MGMSCLLYLKLGSLSTKSSLTGVFYPFLQTSSNNIANMSGVRKDKKNLDSKGWAWIGAQKSDDTWEWSDGSKWSFESWLSKKADKERQDYVRFKFDDGKWDDTKEDHEYVEGYICQYVKDE